MPPSRSWLSSTDSAWAGALPSVAPSGLTQGAAPAWRVPLPPRRQLRRLLVFAAAAARPRPVASNSAQYMGRRLRRRLRSTCLPLCPLITRCFGLSRCSRAPARRRRRCAATTRSLATKRARVRAPHGRL
eukprot:124088-Chlamydomonas_euryale.AAC.4